MKRPSKSFILFLIIVAAIIAAALFYRHQTATKFNTTMVNGNTAGNLYNNGLFCEHNGLIYFANSNDGFRLYSMTTTGTDVTPLSEDAVSSINVDDHYVYYIRDNSTNQYDFSFLHYNNNVLCRADLDGKNETVLETAPCMYATLYGNYFYYLHYDIDSATTAYRIDIDGKNREQISTEAIYPCCADGQYMYYNGIDTEHNIHRLDTQTDQSSTILTGNCWMPQKSDNYIYYMDCDNDYALVRQNLTDPSAAPETLTTDKVECFNVYGSYVFYQKGSTSAPQFKRIGIDGSDPVVIAEGEYENINATSSYIYFTAFDNETVTLRVPTSGFTDVTPFSP